MARQNFLSVDLDAARSTSVCEIVIAAEGLHPSATGVRLRFAVGKRRVIDGPFTESKELIAGYVILKLQSRDEALEWMDPFAKLIGDVEIDIRPLY